MGIKLTWRLDKDGKTFVVFSKGAGAFSVPVVKEGNAPMEKKQPPTAPRIKRTTLVEFLNRKS